MATDHERGGVRLPPHLAPGDVIAVTTPSGPVRAAGRLARGVSALRQLGFDVIVGPQAYIDDPRKRVPEARSEELNSFFRDAGIRAVIAAIGGYTCNAILPYLDYAVLRRQPKIICGYSDITALLLACHNRAGIVTFHGPTLLPEVAEFPAMQDYSRSHFLRVVGRTAPAGRLKAADAWTDEFLAWDIDDNRPRRMQPSAGWLWFGHGHAQGRLVGGNLETISAMAGTPYLPDFSGSIVFLETASTSPELVERSLAHLDMAGTFSGIPAVLFGRPFRTDDIFADQLSILVRRWFADRVISVVTNVDLGHTDPMLTLPIGVRASVDFTHESLAIVDAAVC